MVEIKLPLIDVDVLVEAQAAPIDAHDEARSSVSVVGALPVLALFKLP